MGQGAVLALCVVLAGCQGIGTPQRFLDENAPPPVDPGGDGVDGLLVGHRLMEAGEYELALKSYLRAAAEQGVNVDVLSALGSVNLHLGRLGQAESLLRDAIEADPTFVPALNNLGVVLMEKGQVGEARVLFQQAFANDSGQSDSIRENLRRSIALTENTGYTEANEEEQSFSLVRRGKGQYELLSSL
ncbi:tetratricopeptide repeat protein [Aliigemmobacter aestuarii]|uniref:Tetratricopeptide repeat protein n=1 Tax=Aliigemmobacter aestuarii TaxID=1445661 RepID=A0A4S3MMN7_9RHOB|nr:tetratricopeptide repeat protein [Gemmobacter aestuarii]THD81610.1 tetratricopeptide repeat protein [Gemmobacter aestuarii]